MNGEENQQIKNLENKLAAAKDDTAKVDILI